MVSTTSCAATGTQWVICCGLRSEVRQKRFHGSRVSGHWDRFPRFEGGHRLEFDQSALQIALRYSPASRFAALEISKWLSSLPVSFKASWSSAATCTGYNAGVITKPTIVPARIPDDISVVRALMEEYAEELGIDLGFQAFEDELDRLPGEYAPPAGQLLLARYNDEVIGMAAIRPLGDGVCELKRMVIRPTWRGRGFGRLLGEEAVRTVKYVGFRSIRLDTLARLEAALELYRSMGFVEIDAYRENPCEDAVFMELEL